MAFLSPAQARLLRSVCDVLLPPGEDGPSATEADVVAYIDGQLAGPWGQGARLFGQGPFTAPPDEGHGWQSPMTPADVYANGLDALERFARDRHGADFAGLAPERQQEVVEAWEAGALGPIGDIDCRVFFEMVRRNTIEGLLSDPIHGGNRDMIGWRWLGYPGAASAHGDYTEHVLRYGEPHGLEPRGLSATRADR